MLQFYYANMGEKVEKRDTQSVLYSPLIGWLADKPNYIVCVRRLGRQCYDCYIFDTKKQCVIARRPKSSSIGNGLFGIQADLMYPSQ